jgi:hypothetical protein
MLLDVSVKPGENRSWDDSFTRPRGSSKTEGEAVQYQTRCGSGLACGMVAQVELMCLAGVFLGQRGCH